MAFRRVSVPNNSTTSYSYPPNPTQSNPIPGNPIQHYPPQPQQQQQSQEQSSPTSTQSPSSPSMRKRPRTLDMHPGTSVPTDGHAPPPQPAQPAVGDDAFINDQDAVDSGGDDDEDEEKPKSDKKAGRRKIKIEFIQDKSRRHITFSKRKAGIMKKAYELSTLTGTQVLLLVVSETGLVYTFTTAKLQPLVTQPEGKNLIQACLNAPHGSLPSSMPIGAPLGRPSGPMTMPPPGSNNLIGGLSIGSAPSGSSVKDDEDDGDNDEATHGGRASTGDKRRRRGSSNAGPGGASTASGNPRGATSPHSPNSTIPPPPLSIPATPGQTQPSQAPHQSHQPQQPPPPQISLGSPTSPQQQHQQVSASSPAQYSGGSYGHHPGQQHHQPATQHDAAGMYGSHMISPGGYAYGSGPGSTTGQGGQPPLGGLAAAAAQHSHWGPQQPPVGQGSHYGRR